jgi:hypothetical protein
MRPHRRDEGQARRPRGPRGAAGAEGSLTISRWHIDPERHYAAPILSNGTVGAPLQLRGLFEQFLVDARSAQMTRSHSSCPKTAPPSRPKPGLARCGIRRSRLLTLREDKDENGFIGISLGCDVRRGVGGRPAPVRHAPPLRLHGRFTRRESVRAQRGRRPARRPSLMVKVPYATEEFLRASRATSTYGAALVRYLVQVPR